MEKTIPQIASFNILVILFLPSVPLHLPTSKVKEILWLCSKEEAEKKLLSMMHCRVTRQIQRGKRYGENEGNGECGNVQMGEGQWGR